MKPRETKPGESEPANPASGRGSLDGLTQRLGALEESLTVVAGELGVSAIPSFKRLDPDQVYAEAVRRAIDAVEPLRLAVGRLEARLEEAMLDRARLAGLEDAIARMARRLDALEQSAADPGAADLVAEEVTRQLHALVRDAAAQRGPAPLTAGGDPSALVMGAAERAIVRLTRRLEKLEAWRHHAEEDGKPRGGLMGRLFES